MARHDDERELILAELKAALHEHAERLKKTAVQKLVTLEETAPTERRIA
jgi:hypothetical protein